MIIIVFQAISNVTIRTGFVQSPQDDFPLNGDAATEGTPQYFIVHPFGLPYPGGLASVNIRQNRVTVYQALLGKRYGCEYESYAGFFTCAIGNDYKISVSFCYLDIIHISYISDGWYRL